MPSYIIPAPLPSPSPPRTNNHPLRHTRPRRIRRRIPQIPLNPQRRPPARPHLPTPAASAFHGIPRPPGPQVHRGAIPHRHGDRTRAGGDERVADGDGGDADGGVGAGDGWGRGRRVGERDGSGGGGRGAPVEVEAGDALEGDGGEVDDEGGGGVGARGGPFRGEGAVDGAEGELAGEEGGGGGGGAALEEVARHGEVVEGARVGDDEGAVGRQLVHLRLGARGGGAAAGGAVDVHRDRVGGEGGVVREVGGGQAGQSGVCLVGKRADRPPHPVEGAVAQVGDLRWEGRVDVEDAVEGEAQAEVAVEGDLEGAAVGGEEGERGVGASILRVVVHQLLAELEPWRAGVRLRGGEGVGVGGAAGGGEGGSRD
jgi:hypothetical protein